MKLCHHGWVTATAWALRDSELQLLRLTTSAFGDFSLAVQQGWSPVLVQKNLVVSSVHRVQLHIPAVPKALFYPLVFSSFAFSERLRRKVWQRVQVTSQRAWWASAGWCHSKSSRARRLCRPWVQMWLGFGVWVGWLRNLSAVLLGWGEPNCCDVEHSGNIYCCRRTYYDGNWRIVQQNSSNVWTEMENNNIHCMRVFFAGVFV